MSSATAVSNCLQLKENLANYVLVGVDDAVVDRYGASLRILNGAIASEYGGSERVCFRSLVDLFALDNGQSDVDVPDIEHHLATLRSEEAELCRRILMAGCQAYPGALRANIEGQDPAILGLYRGFSRFMLEDLSRHPLTAALSRSQGKKLAAKVSFEMIHRNQAYSNLVEMLFPDHIRLSIHAHTNAGPKFGIRLFDKSTTKTNIRLSGGEQMSTTDRLHIPTPWHNSVAVIEGDPTVHIVKSQVVHGWLTVKAHEGRYIEGKLDEGCGGYFYLQPEPELEPATSVETNRRLKFGLIMSAGEFIRLSALGLQAWFRSIFRLSRALWLWPKP
jgi:pyoverdine/dityrosine biosynthesis protein Dit1